MKVEWSQLKTFVDTRKLSIQWLDIGNSYWLKAFDGPFSLECDLDKNPSDTTDLDIFEASYKDIGNKNLLNVSSPFTSKVLPDGRKLYTRVHGISFLVENASDNIDFTVPYINCKITGIEVVGCSVGDKINMKVLDTSTGTISGVADYPLNQFGFNVNMPDSMYRYSSVYDADLIQDMKVRIEFIAKDGTLPKTIYLNFILHQVV